MPVIDADLYTGANAFVSNLGGAFGRGWRHQLNDTGSGQLTLDLGDADLAACSRKRIVKFSLDGDVVFAFVIGPRSQQTITQNEGAGEARAIGGPGVLNLTSGARVFPQLGLGDRSPTSRGFGAMSDTYVVGPAWDPATELYRQDDPVNGYGPLWPAGWKCPDAVWIWSRAAAFAAPPMPLGTSCFRAVLSVPTDGEVHFDLAADDGFRFWLDGELVLQRTQAFAWRETSNVTKLLNSGDHVLYIEAENIDRPVAATNFAGLLFGAYTVVSGGEVGSVLLVSDVSWDALDYPDPLPGMTPGAIIKAILDENHSFGYLAEVTQGAWDEDVDENGVPWAAELAPTYTVGSSLFDVLKNLADVDIDAEVDPDTLQLKLYNKGGLGGASGVTLTAGVHYLELTHQDAEDPPTDLLVRISDGRNILHDSGVGGQPVLGYLEAGTATNRSQGFAAADAVFAVKPSKLSAAVAPVAGHRPYDGLVPGSTLTTIDIDGAAVSTKLLAVTVADTPAGEDGTVGGAAIFAIEGEQ